MPFVSGQNTLLYKQNQTYTQKQTESEKQGDLYTKLNNAVLYSGKTHYYRNSNQTYTQRQTETEKQGDKHAEATETKRLTNETEADRVKERDRRGLTVSRDMETSSRSPLTERQKERPAIGMKIYR